MPRNFASNKDETARMFRSNLLESLSHIHFSIPLFIYAPVVLYFLYKSYTLHLSFLLNILLIVLGIFVWTFTEYALHRYVFHFEPKTNFAKRLHFIVHGVHHDYPRDS